MSKTTTTPITPAAKLPPGKYESGQQYRTAEYMRSAENIAQLTEEVRRFVATENAHHQAFLYSLEMWMEKMGMPTTPTPTTP